MVNWGYGFLTSMARNRLNERAGAEWLNVGEAHPKLQRLIGWSFSGRQERKQLAQALSYPGCSIASSFSISGFWASIHSIHCARVASARHWSFLHMASFRLMLVSRKKMRTGQTAYWIHSLSSEFRMLYLSLLKSCHQTTIITISSSYSPYSPNWSRHLQDASKFLEKAKAISNEPKAEKRKANHGSFSMGMPLGD